MNSIRVLLLFLAGIAHDIHAAVNPMIDVSYTKPALLWSVNKIHQNMFYFKNNNYSHNQCYGMTINPNHANNLQHGYTFDLQGTFHIREIIIYSSKNYTNIELVGFDIYIDETKCEDFRKMYSGPKLVFVILKCENNQGRTVSVIPWDQPICHLQILSCGRGMTGENCDEACSSRYGLSCSLPCQCIGNTSCDKYTGYCRRGCSNYGGRHSDCYFKSVEMSSESFFVDFSQEHRTVSTSLPFINTTKNCNVIQFSETSNGLSFWIEWKFSSLKTLRAIEFDFHDEHSTSLAILSVTIDYRPCLVIFLRNYTVSGAHHCHNLNLQGKSIQLIISKNDNSDAGHSLPSICDIKLLACHSGYFGPFCRLPCHCLVLPCHPETGRCTDNKCMPGYKGPNCAQVDLTKVDEMIITEELGTIEELPALFTHGPIPYSWNLTSDVQLWTVVKSIKLTGTYRITHLTVTIAPTIAHLVSNISVYMDPEPVDDALNGVAKSLMKGLPCMESYSINSTSSNLDPATDPMTSYQGTMFLECPGSAAIISVVALGISPLDSGAIRDVGIWTCMDGTFGHRCDRICNCKHSNDVCDKTTGQCLSKCPSTHGGTNCQDEICPPERCKMSCSEESGGCYKSCLPGWMGAKCDTLCPDGFYGDGCLKLCHQCYLISGERTCDARNGSCFHGCKSRVSSAPQLCNNVHKAILASEETSILTGTGIKVFVLTAVPICIFILIIAMCVHNRDNLSRINSDSATGKWAADNVVTFKNIHEGWQWIESMNRTRGFDISCDSCSSSDLTHLQKVAIWILCQNFEEGIIRRRKKLETAAGGSVSETTGSQVSIALDEDLEDFYGIV